MPSVALVTTWDIPCGIAEYGWYLRDAVERADPALQHAIIINLHPDALLSRAGVPDLTVLNFQAALLSQWHPEHIRQVQQRGGRVLAIYHDTGVPSTNQCQGIVRAADLTIVHEPVADLPEEKVVYLRQGIPGWTNEIYTCKEDGRSLTGGRRPVVGTIGFPAPWKNMDLLVEASALAGWGVLLLAPGATPEQLGRWSSVNPEIVVASSFVPKAEATAMLAGCDATAFLHAGMFGGTSGAIRQGLAARKPVLATHPDINRQNRDLYADPVGRSAIWWLQTLTADTVARALMETVIGRVDPRVVALAAQDSWTKQGERIAALYHRLLGVPA